MARQTVEETRRQLIEHAGAIQAELDRAANARVGTQWWNDRIRELQGTLARLELCRKAQGDCITLGDLLAADEAVTAAGE